MLFNSYEFLVFFPIVVALYFAIPNRFRWALLLIASYYFYMCWNYKFIVLIMLSTVVDYFAGILIHKTHKKRPRKLLLLASLVTNLGLLFFFKYFNFFGEAVNMLFDKVNIFYDVPAYDFLLPVGISFYTFQSISYVVDVYRGDVEPTESLLDYAFFLSFFPQIVAGPIVDHVEAGQSVISFGAIVQEGQAYTVGVGNARAHHNGVIGLGNDGHMLDIKNVVC